jgi:hypothetical protein
MRGDWVPDRLRTRIDADVARIGEVMEITEVQMTASVWVDMTKEDLDIIWACAEHHYDVKVVKMTVAYGLLYGIKNQFCDGNGTVTDKVKVHLTFNDLDTIAKALEQAKHLDLIGKREWVATGYYLFCKIIKMLLFINSQGSCWPVEHKVGYEVIK